MFSQGLFRPSATTPAPQRTRHSGMLLHSTQPNSNVVFASGTPSILRETPVAFSASSRPRSHARSLASNTYGLSSAQKYPKVSARIAALAQPKRCRNPYNNEDETPWYPAGAHIVAERTQKKWVPKGKPSPTKKNIEQKSHPSPVFLDTHQPPIFDSEAIDAESAMWEPQIDWEVTNRCTVKGVGCNGTVRWKGVFVGNGLPMIGVELDYAFGDGDGVFWEKHRLFRCPDNCAMLVDPIDVFPPLDDVERDDDQADATVEEKEQAQYLTQHRIERRKSIADAGFDFKYLQLPGLLSWETFRSEPSYQDVPAGLVRLLYDYYLEESEQCRLLRGALDLVSETKNTAPYSKSAMENARRSLEEQIERGLAIQTLHHEELETVCTHIEYQGDTEGLILHSGGMHEGDETGSPIRRDQDHSNARDQQIKDRMRSSQAEQFEIVMQRLESLNLDKEEHTHLEELARVDLAHATETVLALEQLPENQEKARQTRVAQMTSQWEHLKVEHEVLRDRVSLATPSQSNQNRSTSSSHENQGLHHAASKASLEEAGTVTKMTKQWSGTESPQR